MSKPRDEGEIKSLVPMEFLVIGGSLSRQPHWWLGELSEVTYPGRANSLA